ncbi:MAG: hypothetical protein LHV68_09775 [Elusimicrobia bacterium]|nr:hypothetical protein [Candidatus Liberimonas magnetica]
MSSNYPTRTVKCLICGKRFKGVNSGHLISKHGYNREHPVEDYKNDYGLRKATSEYTRGLIGKLKIGNKYWVGRKHKRSTKLKLRLVHLGVKEKEGIGKIISRARIGNKNALGYKHTKAFKKWISALNKKLWAENRGKYGQIGQGGNKKALFVSE